MLETNKIYNENCLDTVNRMPEDMMDALYDEQRNTQVLLDAVLNMNPEQTIEVIKAFKESKLIP